MKVQLDGKEIWIEFAYSINYPTDEFEPREVTSCLLRNGSAPRGKDKLAPVIAKGEASRYFKDPPNRDIARKAALTKALKDLDLDKASRRLFWEAYLNRKKKPAVEGCAS